MTFYSTKISALIFLFLNIYVTPVVADSAWSAAIMRGLAGYAKGRAEDIRLQQEYERQKELIIFRQELEYRRQLSLQKQYEADLERSTKLAEEAKRLEKERALLERERLLKEEEKLRELAEIERITVLAEKTEKNQSIEIENDISKTIPNWKAILVKKDFSDWFYLQPQHIQVLADSNSPSDVIKLIKLFKNKKD